MKSGGIEGYKAGGESPTDARGALDKITVRIQAHRREPVLAAPDFDALASFSSTASLTKTRRAIPRSAATGLARRKMESEIFSVVFTAMEGAPS